MYLLRAISLLAPALILLLPTAVHADGAAIVSAVNTITADTTQLNATVAAFEGNPLDTLPIITQSTALLAAINNGTSVADRSADLTDAESLSVAEAVLTLAADVNATLATIVAKKPRFDALLIVSPVVLLNLDLERSASARFGAAVEAKLPQALQSAAAGVVAGIDAAFANAIRVYDYGI